ncbi:uncharacterized protein LOC142177112 [Nicotiana tabacum]|uniref:Uncharacterized protein LOC142177112 n=1 Tax=Nicotiana tabacum TaxID=4097 RepID=A0AC58TWQ6_TOBAC
MPMKDLKRYLPSPPLLSKPEEGEQLLIYLTVSEVAVSAVLVREDEGRLAKWAVKINEFDIEYKPRTAIKSQVLADFVPNFNPGLLCLATKDAVKGFGIGVVLIMPSGETLRRAIRTVPLTNNEAEYEALIGGLELARGLDSKFREWSITHILREENAEEDALANLGSSTKVKGTDFGMVVQLMHLVLDVDGYYKVTATNLVWDWRNEIIEYLEHGKLPEDPKASRALCTKEARYSFKGGQLYRRSF